MSSEIIFNIKNNLAQTYYTTIAGDKLEIRLRAVVQQINKPTHNTFLQLYFTNKYRGKNTVRTSDPPAG